MEASHAPTQANHIGTWLALVEPVLAARVLAAAETALAYAEQFDSDTDDVTALRELAQTIAAELGPPSLGVCEGCGVTPVVIVIHHGSGWNSSICEACYLTHYENDETYTGSWEVLDDRRPQTIAAELAAPGEAPVIPERGWWNEAGPAARGER